MYSIFVEDATCLGCKSCELACCIAHSSSKTLFGALGEAGILQNRIHVEPCGKGAFPLQCRHCSEPQCAKACVTGALQWQDGAVAYDASRCLGCQMCVIACPFGLCESLKTAHPSGDAFQGISKCDLCANRSAGPACVEACPTGSLSFASPEDFSKAKRRSYLVHLQKEAL
ncbi:MAG: 4Fe-4S binding protein [Treponema sp.]|jgi:carbon-monoxide dehydrogenase iron sulfur subunit|nr:4Fe-4S binding protein [Treponema sp.]